MSATSIDTSQATDASSTLSGMTTVIYSTVSNSIVQVVTTTSYSGAPVPSGGVWQHTKQPIPVAPIAGGAAGGVFLAVAVVVAWVWWGKCIKRRDKKEKKEALARLEVRENTRRNASSGSFTSIPRSSRTSRREKKVSFASAPPSMASTLRGTIDEAKDDARSEKSSAALVNHKPVRPSPLGRANSEGEQAPLMSMTRTPSSRATTPPQSPFRDAAAPPSRRQSQDSATRRPPRAPTPISPRRPSQDSAPRSPRRSSQDSAPLRRPSQDSATPFPTQTSRPTPRTTPSPAQSPSPTSSVQPFLKRPLVNKQVTHKASTTSSMSAYSNESGEERQKRVSSSLVMAALGHLDPRRSFLGNYLPLNRRSRVVDDVEQSRLSTVSAASAYSQPEAGEPVGYAYGGEDGELPR